MKGKYKLPLLLLAIISLTVLLIKAPQTGRIALAAAALIWVAKTYLDKVQAEKKLKKQDQELQTLRKENEENKEKLSRFQTNLEKQVGQEMKKAHPAPETRTREAAIRDDYWAKIGDLTPLGGSKETETLEAEKQSIDQIIELTRSKFRSGIIDEGTCKKITNDYLRRLIEIESRLKTINTEKTPPKTE